MVYNKMSSSESLADLLTNSSQISDRLIVYGQNCLAPMCALSQGKPASPSFI